MEEFKEKIKKEYEKLPSCKETFEIMGCKERVRDLYYQSFNLILKEQFYKECFIQTAHKIRVL